MFFDGLGATSVRRTAIFDFGRPRRDLGGDLGPSEIFKLGTASTAIFELGTASTTIFKLGTASTTIFELGTAGLDNDFGTLDGLDNNFRAWATSGRPQTAQIRNLSS